MLGKLLKSCRVFHIVPPRRHGLSGNRVSQRANNTRLSQMTGVCVEFQFPLIRAQPQVVSDDGLSVSPCPLKSRVVALKMHDRSYPSRRLIY